ncbi:hypothetical protein PFISCL1PPCAC_18243, partial [Pristionchus fissidentatus]
SGTESPVGITYQNTLHMTPTRTGSPLEHHYPGIESPVHVTPARTGSPHYPTTPGSRPMTPSNLVGPRTSTPRDSPLGLTTTRELTLSPMSPKTPDRPLFNEKWMMNNNSPLWREGESPTSTTSSSHLTSPMDRKRTMTPTSVTTSQSFRFFMDETKDSKRFSNTSLHSIQDERDTIQKKTFTKWVNKHLRKATRNVDDLFIDLRDGNNLISLLEVLSAENLLRENGNTRFHRIQNIQYCLDWLKMKNIKLVNIRPEDIVEGNGKLTLGLIWTIILNFQVSVIKQRQRADAAAVRAAAGYANGGGETGSLNATLNSTLEALEGGSARDALLQWARRTTEGYPRVSVNNFSSSWRDGLAFNAILHRYRPKAINWDQISDPSVSNRERLANAFEVAKREFDVDKLLDPEDVDVDHPDEKSIITYVSSLYNNLPNLPEASKGSLADLISRLTRGIGITNEKLDLILLRIEDAESRADSARPAEIERLVNEIVDDLNALETPIAGFFEDVETLKQHNHPDSADFYKQVLGLHQRRNAYLDRLNNQLLVRLGVRTETMRRQQMEESADHRRKRFGRVEECIEWVRSHMERLVNMEFVQSLETLEQMFERHKVDNRDIQDFRQDVDMCIARQSEITAEDSVEYCELLRVLESEYQQLRDLSAGRMLDLDSLIAFVRAAQQELVWVSEREEIEVHRNWSDINQLDLPMLSNYFKQLLHEMELREPQYNDVHNRGAALLNQGHPAIQVIEVYIQTLKKQWDWLLNLSKCLESHLRDANNLKQFMEDAASAEASIKEHVELLERNYNRTDFSLEEGERMLMEMDNYKELLDRIQSILHSLHERCATISPLWQRGERIAKPMTVTALCDYEDTNVNIRAGDDVILIDNGDLVHWKIQDVMGKQGIVPSVVFRIPPPDTRLTAWLTRLLQQFEKLRKLWDLKHRMIRFYMVLNTMKTIQGWDVNMFNSLDPDQRDAIIKALNDDTNKLLSELDPNDPLAQRLRDELKKTMDHFWSLFNAAARKPEEDLSNQFDQMLADLLRKLEEAWRALKERTGRPIPRTAEELERALREQRDFEELLQSLDGDVNNLKDIFSKMANPSPSQRHNMDRVNVLWDDSWDLSKMYVERMKVLDMVIAGIFEVKDIVRAHEVTLNSFDDLPCALDKLRGEHAQLVELNMVLKQQQTVIDQLNHNVSLLRQHVARTRLDTSTHPDVDRLEEEVQHLNNRWENVQSQLTERLRITELALQIQMVYRGEYENEMAWLDRVEETINKLRKPEELRPEQYQKELDLLVAEYSQLQKRTDAIENVNREGGKFIREAKGYDGRLKQYGDAIRGIHGRDIERDFKRTHPQPKNGAQIVTEELEALNRRFAQLSSLILEKRNVMQVLIQNWKREQQDSAIREAMNQQAQIGDLLSDLNGFEEQIYRTHLSFDLSRPDAGGASRNMQNLRSDLDSYAEKVKLKLETVDRLCHEGADKLTPEQFAELKEARARLERNYEAVVRTVENLQTRLNAIALLVIEFSSKSSEMQSWITDATRRSGDIRANSADPRMLPEERRRAKALMEDIATKEHELKALNALFARLEAEIDEMYAENPAARDTGAIHADDVRRTLGRVESDYSDLYRQAADLSVFQNRIAALGGELEESGRRTHEWLSKLEANLDATDGSTIEEKLRRAEEMKEKAAADRSLLDDHETASRRLLDALQGTAAHGETAERHEKAMRDQRKRHEEVLDRVQAKVNETLAEKAAADGIKKAVGDLAAWSASFEGAVNDALRRGLPLRQGSIDAMKSDEQRMRSELDAHAALAEKMEKEAKMAGIDGLDAKVADAKKALRRSNSALTGWRDNLADAAAGLADLATGAAAAERASDQVAAALKHTTPKDAARLREIEREMEALAAAQSRVAETANKLLGLPDVNEEDAVKNTVASIDNRVAALAADLEQKQAAAGEMAEVEGRMEEKRNEALALLSSLDARLSGARPVALSVVALGKQRSEVAEWQRELAAIGPLVEEMEECAERLWEGAGSSSLRAGTNILSGNKRVALETSGKFQSLDDALKARSGRINENEAALAVFDGSADDLERWMGREKEKIRSECGIPESADDATSIGRKIDRLEKEIRGERRLLEEVARAGADLRRANAPDAPGADRVAERVRALEDDWGKMGEEMDQARSRLRVSEQLHDRAAALGKWMGAQRRHLDAIGAPSADVNAVKAQKRQLELIRDSIEDEIPVWSKLNEMAGELVNEAPEGSNYGKVVQKTDDLNRDWAKLRGDVDRRLARVDAVAEASGSIHGSLRELKKEMAELEAECSRVARLPLNEEGKRMENLDSLLNRTADLDGSLLNLDQSLKELSIGEDDEAVEWSEVSDAVGTVRNRTDEISKRLEGMRKAAESARGKEEELDKQMDGLIDLARSTRAALAEGGAPAADAARTAEESRRMDEIVAKLLARDGEVAMAKFRAEEQLKSRPDDASLREKSERLAIEWTPLVEEARKRKANLNQLDDLLKQYDDQHESLEKKMKEDEEEMARLLAILAADKDNAEALHKLTELENSSDRRKAESDALDKVAERIDAIAPGADARRLKRKSEKLGEDARARAKKTRATIAGMGKKADLHARLSQLLGDAAEMAENYKKDLEESGERMDKARVQSTQHAAAADWKRAEREIAAIAEQLKEMSPESAAHVDESIGETRGAFDDVRDILNSLEQQLEAAGAAADQVKESAAAVAAGAAKLAEELADTADDIGRSPEDLERNRAECEEQERAIEAKMKEIEEALSSLTAARDAGVLTPSQFEAAKAGLEEAKRAMEKAGKRLAARRKKIDQADAEIKRIKGDASSLRDALAALAAAPILSSEQARGDPSSQGAALKEVKEHLRPLSDRVAALVGDCQAMIKSAPAEVNTKALDALLRDTVAAHDEVAGKVAERERAVDAAAQQMGKYEDAYKALLNWLEETEEMMANQADPSADAKVARAQRATFDVFLKHLEDKQPSVDGFSALIAKMRDLTASEEEKNALKDKDEQIANRYSDLLTRAQEGQAKLRDAVDLAERYTSLETPLRAWMQSTEKAMNGLGQIPIDGERLEKQRGEQKRIEAELGEKRDDVKALVETGARLAALVSVNDATDVTARADALRRQYDQMNGRCEACGDSIENVALHLDQFLAELAELESWLTEMEVNMLSLEDLAIDDQDELAEQANLLSELGVDVTEHEGRFSDVITVGLELCRQTSRDEAMALQHRIDALKMRISDLSGVTDEKLEVMERAIPLTERFHAGFESAMEWIEAVEEDLRMLDEVPLETQLQIVANIEEDLALWRPDIDQVVAMSSQLQSMTSNERASALHANTTDMNRRANAIGEQVTRRSERLMMAERQSRGVIDELDFVTEWLEEAKERVSAAAPPSIVPEYVKTQLKNQRLLNEDVATQRSRLRDTIAEAKKIARQVGVEGGTHDAALLAKAEAAKYLADEVAEISEKRAERLEEGLALATHIESAQDDIADWLASMEREIESAPSVMTGTPMAALAAQQKHNMELAAAISAQRALIDRFEKDVTALQSIAHPEDAERLEEIRGDIAARVEEIRQNVNERGAALDSVMDVSSALGERLDAMHAALAAEAARLRLDEPLTADISALESRVADARNQAEGLRQKEPVMDSLRERVHDMMGTGDSSAQELIDKMGQLEKLWTELGRGAELKEQLLSDALGKARRFWGDLDTCERAVDDLKKRLDAIEPCVGQPEVIEAQTRSLDVIAEVVDSLPPLVDELRAAGSELSRIVPADEKAAISSRIDNVEADTATITALCAQRYGDLGRALEEAMAFHGDMDSLAEYLGAAEAVFLSLPALEELAPEEIAGQLDAVQAIRADLDAGSLLKEQLQLRANEIAEGAPANQVAAIRQPVAELAARWSRLNNGLAEREHAINRSLLEKGQLLETAEQLLLWVEKTQSTVADLSLDGPSNLGQIEIALCKLAVVKNDVHAHEPSIMALNRTVRSTEGVDPTISRMVDVINVKWSELLRAIEAIAIGLDKSRDEAEQVGDEMERWNGWTDDVLAALEPRRALPGVPETAQEQMDEFLVTRAEMEQTRPAIEAYLRRNGHDGTADQNTWMGRSQAKLESKWNRIKDLANTRQRKLEVAGERAEQLDGELVELRGWLEGAEKALADAGAISRLPEGLERQRNEQEERMEEIERRKAQFVDTKSLAGQIRASCEARDAIYVKNQTVTLESKLNKFVARAAERSKQLDGASQETETWLDGVASLEDWMDEIKRKTDATPPTTSDVDRLKSALEEAKSTADEVSARRPQFEMTRKRGISLCEHAPKGERKEIEKRNDELRKRWESAAAAADARCTEAEKAVLEGGAFSEALANLEEWLDGELAEGAVRKEKGVRGDVDTVAELVAAENKREETRKKKADTIGAITKKARSLVAEGVEEAPAIAEAASRLEEKWAEMEGDGKRRKEELERAMEEARDVDAKVHGLLDWLAEVEGRLKMAPSADLASSISAAGAVRAALAAECPRLARVDEACASLLDGCHPDAVPALKEWRRVVAARWKEVEDRAAAKEDSMREEEEKARAREAALHEMNEFVERKRLELDEASILPPPSSVEEAERRLKDHEEYERELRERQGDVDGLTKGRRKDGERDKRADALAERWRRLWADSIGHSEQLEKDRAHQEELKRLQGWKFDEWRDRYVEWNDHGKARVNDLFRRLDRSSTGSVPRDAFIDAIIASKFPTSRLEMAKVADKFDKGDGMINAKEFINALKIGNRKVTTPKSPDEQKQMIKNEMTRRRDQCSCAHKYRIDHEEDAPGKVQPKSDGGVLQTYRFGDQQIRRMVRILHTTVMVRVGGGWEPLDEFLDKHDPCKAKDRTNTSIYQQFYDDVRPAHAADKMYTFTKGQHAREDYGSPSSATASSPHARSSPKENVTVLRPFVQSGTPGPSKGVREKTEKRSVPMFGENRFARERAESQELLDSSRPSSRAASEVSDAERPSRIPSLRSKKGQRYNPPSAKK